MTRSDIVRSQWPERRSRRAARPSRRRRWLFPPAMAVAGAVLFATLSAVLDRAGNEYRPFPSVIGHLEYALLQAGLGLDQIEVTGHRFTSDHDILDAVDLPNVRSLLSFDGAAVRRRIERLPWVATATIHRLFPNGLRIVISERPAFALWQRGRSDALIDASGRVLAMIAVNSATGLPRIAGEGAPEDASRLLEMIATVPNLMANLDVAERVAGRRWRLRLHNGTTVELPAEADAAAVSMLAEVRTGGRLIDVAAGVIDLTVPRRIIMRQLHGQGQGDARG